MKIVFLGSGAFGVESLRFLHASVHHVPLVFTQPSRPAGRGRKMVATPIGQLATTLNIECVETADVNSSVHVEKIKHFKPDIIMVIAIGQKLGSELLNIPNCKVLNLHSSLLPKYRGAAPVNWAILNGESQSGVTIIELDDVWDGGNIWGSLATPIQTSETASELHDRLACLGPQCIKMVIDRIKTDTYVPEVQNIKLATRAPKLCKADGAIDFFKSAPEVYNHIQGMWSWPGAFCFFTLENSNKKQRLAVARCEIVPNEQDNTTSIDAPPGRLLDDMTIVCGNGKIKFLEVKPDNSKLMSFTDFTNGRRISGGIQFQNGN